MLCAALTMAQSNYYEVSTAQELKTAVLENCTDGVSTSNIKLMADIYLSDLGNDCQHTLCTTFKGTIDGGYPGIDPLTGLETILTRVIYAGHEDELDGGQHKKVSYLFTNTLWATIQNVTFKNFRVDSENQSHQAVITQEAYNTNFSNIKFDHCSIFSNEDYSGIAVGLASVCIFEAVRTEYCDVTVDGYGAGGLAGHSDASQYNGCVIDASSNVFADGTAGVNEAYCGGLVGYSTGDWFENCLNAGLVGANDDGVGGIVGESHLSNFFKCLNYGKVIQTDEEGFADLCNDRNKKLEDVKSESDDIFQLGGIFTGTMLGGGITFGAAGLAMAADIAMGAVGLIFGGGFFVLVPVMIIVGSAIGTAMVGHDENGGICGKAVGGKFDRCQNMGELRCKDDYLGGIVGIGQGVEIINCYHGGKLDIDEVKTSGSIIGCAEKLGETGCKVSNCLSVENVPIVGKPTSLQNGSDNNYRLTTGTPDITGTLEKTVNSEMLASGKIAYYLNRQVTDGTQVWSQIIGHDALPVLDGNPMAGNSTVYKVAGEDRYSNYPIDANGTVANVTLYDADVYTNPYTFTATELSYSRDLSALTGTDWGSLYLPFDLPYDAAPGFSFYTLTGADAESLTFSPVESGVIEAGTPMLFKRTAGATSLDFTLNDVLVHASADQHPLTQSDVEMCGTYTTLLMTDLQSKADCYYYLGKDEKIHRALKSLTVTPYRCYFMSTDVYGPDASQPAQSRAIVISDEAAGLDAVMDTDGQIYDVDVIYDANGSRHNEMQQGLNIVRLKDGSTRKIMLNK